MIKRAVLKNHLKNSLRRSRAVALLGMRQCGKTTLARELVDVSSKNYFDLEDPESLARLNDPKTELSPLKGLVVIDEVQRRPDLFPILRVLLDRRPLPAKFLLLGSASPELLRQSSESLAGRMETIEIGGFDISEIGSRKAHQLWLRGGLPLSFLAKNDTDSFVWRKNYIQNFLELDLRRQGIEMPMVALHRFWTMIAHMHGQIWNAADPARSLGVSEPTIRKYLDIFTGLFMVRQIQPWFANIGKRQVKSPKVFMRDSGILHALLNIRTDDDLPTNLKLGASWEGFVIEEITRSVEPDDLYFWATHSGAEIDLVFHKEGLMYGVEIKRSDAPVMTPSIQHAIKDLKLKRVAVIYPGKQRYSIGDNVSAVPFDSVVDGMDGIFGK